MTELPLRDLPKISLHDHLDGGLRPATVLELAAEESLELPGGAPQAEPSEASAQALAEWFRQRCTSGSLVEYLTTFDVTLAVMQTRAGLTRVAREFVEDLVADGVIYGEIRWAPEQHLRRGLSLDDAVEAVQEGIDQAIEASDRVIRVGQLVSAMRQADRGVEIAELALRHRDRGVVGFDIAGPEAGFPASRMREAFELLQREMLPVTVHAGEADGLESIRGALIDGHALRLGHGVRIAEDVTIDSEDDEGVSVSLGRLASWVRDRRIPLEVSPSSNLQTGAFAAWGDTLADHPLDMLFQLGFRVTVNTDNRLMSATSLTRELGLLVDTFDYGLAELLQLQLNAAEGAFLPLEDRDELADLLHEGFGTA
ncbi:MAG: adenosine deaminase [Actinomycetales bacterium]|nr:adenosine deaminase [Actinomycetales bacterium]